MMGCYWNCNCEFVVDKHSAMDEIIDRIKQKKYGFLDFDKLESVLWIGYSDHACYGFGEDFESVISDVAEEFHLDGTMFISTNEDECEPPQKTTFEHGKTVHWKSEVIYTREE